MKEIVKDIRRWQKQEKKIAVARVIDLDGSGPRLPGAAMAVTAGRRRGDAAAAARFCNRRATLGSVAGTRAHVHNTLSAARTLESTAHGAESKLWLPLHSDPALCCGQAAARRRLPTAEGL